MTVLDDELVYHYTDWEAFFSIVKSKCLWASDLEALNDPAELYTARGLLHNILSVSSYRDDSHASAIQQVLGLTYLRPRWEFARESRAEFRRFAEGATDYLLKTSADLHWSSLIGHVFGVSFCKVPDLLSQWRAYGLNGGGVCVGFDREELETCFLGVSELVDVKYEPKEQVQPVLHLIRMSFEHYQAKMRQLDPSGSRFGQPDDTGISEQGHLLLTIQEEEKRSFKENGIIEDWVNDALSKLSVVAHKFKLNAFSEEREVRLVCRLRANASEPELAKVQLRAREGKLSPYLEMKPTTSVLPIRRVIFGPASKSFDQVYALKIFLARHGHKGVEFDPSKFVLQ